MPGLTASFAVAAAATLAVHPVAPAVAVPPGDAAAEPCVIILPLDPDAGAPLQDLLRELLAALEKLVGSGDATDPAGGGADGAECPTPTGRTGTADDAADPVPADPVPGPAGPAPGQARDPGAAGPGAADPGDDEGDRGDAGGTDVDTDGAGSGRDDPTGGAGAENSAGADTSTGGSGGDSDRGESGSGESGSGESGGGESGDGEIGEGGESDADGSGGEATDSDRGDGSSDGEEPGGAESGGGGATDSDGSGDGSSEGGESEGGESSGGGAGGADDGASDGDGDADVSAASASDGSGAGSDGGNAGPDAPAAGGAAQTPGDLLDLQNFFLTLPVGPEGDPDSIDQPELLTYSSEHFQLTPEGDGVVFRAPAGGVTTENSKYARSELREMNGEEKAAWSNTSGTHVLETRQAITEVPPAKPEVVAAQIHDGGDDVLQIRLEGQTLVAQYADGEEQIVIDPAYQLGTPYDLRIVAADGRVTVFYNGEQRAEIARSGTSWYFKIGAYTQSNPEKGDSPDAVGEVVVYSLSIEHTGT